MASYYNFTVTPFKWHQREDGLYVIDKAFRITLQAENGELSKYQIRKGFITDGGSIPKCFSWFAPSWEPSGSDTDNDYNACFILHDGLYASELESKAIADDMLRSSLRDVGMNRFHASTICFCVNHFASKHYGKEHDKWGDASFIRRIE